MIIKFNAKPVKDIFEYKDILSSQSPGDTALITILRTGEALEYKIVLDPQ